MEYEVIQAKRRDIDDVIDELHNSKSHLTLHEYLGMNKDEYREYVRSNTIPAHLSDKLY